MGPGAHECADELARLIATRRNGDTPPRRDFVGTVRREVYGRLGLALKRELSEQIISSFACCPRAGLTAENAHVHSRYRSCWAGAPSLVFAFVILTMLGALVARAMPLRPGHGRSGAAVRAFSCAVGGH